MCVYVCVFTSVFTSVLTRAWTGVHAMLNVKWWTLCGADAWAAKQPSIWQRRIYMSLCMNHGSSTRACAILALLWQAS